MISENVAITNRHVALTFAQKNNQGFGYRRDHYRAFVDFKEEHLQIGSHEVEVEDNLYIAEDQEDFPDLAFLKLKQDNSNILPPPLFLYPQTPFKGQMIVTIGYPAYDSRNSAEDMSRIFSDVYNVGKFQQSRDLSHSISANSLCLQ